MQVEQLILSELERLAGTGFSATAIEAAVNSIEFSLRENNTGSFPRGLSLMLRSLASWIYDKDPFQPLQWKDDLQRFKASHICICKALPHTHQRSQTSMGPQPNAAPPAVCSMIMTCSASTTAIMPAQMPQQLS